MNDVIVCSSQLNRTWWVISGVWIRITGSVFPLTSCSLTWKLSRRGGNRKKGGWSKWCPPDRLHLCIINARASLMMLAGHGWSSSVLCASTCWSPSCCRCILRVCSGKLSSRWDGLRQMSGTGGAAPPTAVIGLDLGGSWHRGAIQRSRASAQTYLLTSSVQPPPSAARTRTGTRAPLRLPSLVAAPRRRSSMARLRYKSPPSGWRRTCV